MANADFSRQPNTTGGFDASSYRAAAPAEEEVRLTPFQQKLASLEKALPAALSKQAVAVALCIVVMLGCFVGFGGAKLRAKYDTVKNGFTTGVAADSGYTLNEELTTRLNTAANIITTASNVNTWVNLCSALSVKNVTSFYKLSVCSFRTKSLGLRITSVLCGTNTFLMCEELKVHFHHFCYTSLKITSKYCPCSSSTEVRPRISDLNNKLPSSESSSVNTTSISASSWFTSI